MTSSLQFEIVEVRDHKMETSLYPERSSLVEQKVTRMAEEIERLRTTLIEERTARMAAETPMQAAMEGQELHYNNSRQR